MKRAEVIKENCEQRLLLSAKMSFAQEREREKEGRKRGKEKKNFFMTLKTNFSLVYSRCGSISCHTTQAGGNSLLGGMEVKIKRQVRLARRFG